jgi:hypothetical protein
MTLVQRVAQIFGIVFIVITVLGFIASKGSMEADPAMAPTILGLFPTNLLHNLVHLVFGVWGIVASRSFGAAKQYATLVGVIYIVLAIFGYFVPDTFGLIPIGGNDIWLHCLIGVLLLVSGLTARGAVAAAG